MSATRFSAVVDQCDFLDNKRGVLINTHTGVKVIRNSFEMGGFQSNDTKYGASILNSANYRVEQNQFSPSTNAAGNPVLLGLWMNNTKNNAHQVFNNNFENLAIANLIHGDNGKNTFTGFGGLQYLCNENVNNALDFTLIKALGVPAAIADDQGGVGQPARNTFSIPLNTSHFFDWHFLNDASRQSLVRYHADMSQVPQAPTDVINTIVINTPGGGLNFCNDNYTNPAVFKTQKQNGNEIAIEKLKEKYYNAAEKYDVLVQKYQRLIDKSNTPVLVTEINTTLPQHKNRLKDTLLSISPFLSDTALLATATCGLYNKIQLKKIIKENPDVILDKEFIKRLKDSCTTPLDSNDIADLITSVPSALQPNKKEFRRTELLSKIEEQGQKLFFWANEVIFYYANDTLSPNYDSLEVWIKNKPGLSAAYELAEHYWNQKRYVDALQYINLMPTQHILKGVDYENHLNYVLLKNTLYSAYLDGNSEATLTRKDVDVLRDIANDNFGFASTQAANIVNFFYDYQYFYHPTLPDGLNGVAARSSMVENTNEAEKTTTIVLSPRLWGYPNPTNTWADIIYELPNDTKDATLVISNTAGQIFENIKLTDRQGVVNLNTENWVSGVYFAVLYCSKGTSNVYKMVIRK